MQEKIEALLADLEIRRSHADELSKKAVSHREFHSGQKEAFEVTMMLIEDSLLESKE